MSRFKLSIVIALFLSLLALLTEQTKANHEATVTPFESTEPANGWIRECADCPLLTDDFPNVNLQYDLDGNPHFMTNGKQLTHHWMKNDTWYSEQIAFALTAETGVVSGAEVFEFRLDSKDQLHLLIITRRYLTPEPLDQDRDRQPMPANAENKRIPPPEPEFHDAYYAVKDRSGIWHVELLTSWLGQYTPYVARFELDEDDAVHVLMRDSSGLIYQHNADDDWRRYPVPDSLNTYGKDFELALVNDTAHAVFGLSPYGIDHYYLEDGEWKQGSLRDSSEFGADVMSQLQVASDQSLHLVAVQQFSAAYYFHANGSSLSKQPIVVAKNTIDKILFPQLVIDADDQIYSLINIQYETDGGGFPAEDQAILKYGVGDLSGEWINKDLLTAPIAMPISLAIKDNAEPTFVGLTDRALAFFTIEADGKLQREQIAYRRYSNFFRDGFAPPVLLLDEDEVHIIYSAGYEPYYFGLTIQMASKDSSGTWTHTQIDDEYVHEFTDILAEVDDFGRIHIIYSKRGTDASSVLNYAVYDGEAWKTTELANIYAQHLALTVDENNSPHVAYFAEDLGYYYLTLEDDGWTKPKFVSMSIGREVKLTAFDGVPVIVQKQSDNVLEIQKLIAGEWEKSQIVLTASNKYRTYGVGFDSSGILHLAYADLAINHCKDSSGTWECAIVDTYETVAPNPTNVHLAIGDDDAIHLAYRYYDQNSAEWQVRHAIQDGTEWTIFPLSDLDTPLYQYDFELDEQQRPHFSYMTWRNDQIVHLFKALTPTDQVLLPITMTR